MLQPVDIQRHAELKAHVQALGLRRPVAEIVKKTGAKKGNVSDYLSGKKPFSDNFFRTFREAFNLPEPMEKEPTVQELMKDHNKLLAQLNEQMARHNSLLERQANAIAVRAKVIDANLLEILVGVEKVAVVQNGVIRKAVKPPAKGQSKNHSSDVNKK